MYKLKYTECQHCKKPQTHVEQLFKRCAKCGRAQKGEGTYETA